MRRLRDRWRRWRDPRAAAADQRIEDINATICPLCGESRVFWRDGRRMLAPPHRHLLEQRP